jgi:hypothetical protein
LALRLYPGCQEARQALAAAEAAGKEAGNRP